jgi:hypothetical protein
MSYIRDTAVLEWLEEDAWAANLQLPGSLYFTFVRKVDMSPSPNLVSQPRAQPTFYHEDA